MLNYITRDRLAAVQAGNPPRPTNSNYRVRPTITKKVCDWCKEYIPITNGVCSYCGAPAETKLYREVVEDTRSPWGLIVKVFLCIVAVSVVVSVISSNSSQSVQDSPPTGTPKQIASYQLQSDGYSEINTKDVKVSGKNVQAWVAGTSNDTSSFAQEIVIVFKPGLVTAPPMCDNSVYICNTVDNRTLTIDSTNDTYPLFSS